MSKTKTHSDMDDIRKDLDSLKNNVVELTKHMKNEGVSQTKHLKDVASDRLDDVKDAGRQQMADVERHIKDKPTESIAIAFAAGLVASYLFGRR
jgi:ElaB/YqjD/DUF883 family membrane-anchored ribosome-binding protein